MLSQRPSPLYTFDVDLLRVEVYDSNQEMGAAAAFDAAGQFHHLLTQRPSVRAIFAAAPSQDTFLASLRQADEVAWKSVQGLHMDEYINLPEGAPQSFGYFLQESIFAPVGMPVEYIDGRASDTQAECDRYSSVLQASPIDVVCAGIGENGHMAFNDPHVACFDDPAWVKIVSLDDVCRMQQVHDGAFATFEDVPDVAITLTIPALMSATRLFCMVPGSNKAAAVMRTLTGDISEECPATIMRRHGGAVLYLDSASAAGVI